MFKHGKSEYSSLESQVATLTTEAERRSWQLTLVREQASGKSLARRPLLSDALARLDAHGGILVVTKLDRLSRSMLDFVSIVERARKHGWSLISLDLNLDTSTAIGSFTAQVLIAFGEMERKLISERTKAGLAVKKARGEQLGKPSTVPAETKKQIMDMRAAGVSWRGIARKLNADGVTPPSGKAGAWHTTSVVRVANR
jgi:DNA invertase Pin-like site-specific DNA recombinase